MEREGGDRGGEREGWEENRRNQKGWKRGQDAGAQIKQQGFWEGRRERSGQVRLVVWTVP